MEFSICIVSFNCRDQLRICLESIRANRPTVDHEVVVVDNGSTDGTEEMLQTDFYWVRSIINPNNRGFSVACNQAIFASSGKILMMLNPDTMVERGTFDTLLHFVRERPWIGVVGPKILSAENVPELSCREFPTLLNALWNLTGLNRRFKASKVFGHLDMGWWDHAEPRAVDWLSAAALVFTRTAWEKVGALDERFFLYCVELDWQKRLARKELERWYLPTAVIRHEPHRSWDSRDPAIAAPLYAEVLRYFRKHHGIVSSITLHVMTAAVTLFKTGFRAITALIPARQERDQNAVRLNWAIFRTAIGFPPKI